MFGAFDHDNSARAKPGGKTFRRGGVCHPVRSGGDDEDGRRRVDRKLRIVKTSHEAKSGMEPAYRQARREDTRSRRDEIRRSCEPAEVGREYISLEWPEPASRPVVARDQGAAEPQRVERPDEESDRAAMTDAPGRDQRRSQDETARTGIDRLPRRREAPPRPSNGRGRTTDAGSGAPAPTARGPPDRVRSVKSRRRGPFGCFARADPSRPARASPSPPPRTRATAVRPRPQSIFQ